MFMNEDQKILEAIKSAIIVIAKQIKKDKGCGGDKLNAFGRLINAYNRLYEQITKQDDDPEDFLKTPKMIKIKKKMNSPG